MTMTTVWAPPPATVLGSVCVTVLNPPAPAPSDVIWPPVPPVARLFWTAELTNDVTNELAAPGELATLVVVGTKGWTVETVEKTGKAVVLVGETGKVVGERVACVWRAVVAAAVLVLASPPFPPPAVLLAAVFVGTSWVVVVVKVVVVVVVPSPRLACRCTRGVESGVSHEGRGPGGGEARGGRTLTRWKRCESFEWPNMASERCVDEGKSARLTD